MLIVGLLKSSEILNCTTFLLQENGLTIISNSLYTRIFDYNQSEMYSNNSKALQEPGYISISISNLCKKIRHSGSMMTRFSKFFYYNNNYHLQSYDYIFLSFFPQTSKTKQLVSDLKLLQMLLLWVLYLWNHSWNNIFPLGLKLLEIQSVLFVGKWTF